MVTMAERSEPFSPDETFNAIAAQVESQQSLPNSAESFEDEVNADSEIDFVAPPSEVGAALEAILMVAEQPVEVGLLAQILEISTETVVSLCSYLADSYEDEGRGFTIARIAGGYRYQTVEAQSPYVERFILEGQMTRLSSAALETLAIVAYKQPISRAQITAIRGVNVDGVVRTLQQRGYINEVARDSGPGSAGLYGTTPRFLERLGLNSLEELPSLGEFVPESEIFETLELALRNSSEDESGIAE